MSGQQTVICVDTLRRWLEYAEAIHEFTPHGTVPNRESFRLISGIEFAIQLAEEPLPKEQKCIK